MNEKELYHVFALLQTAEMLRALGQSFNPLHNYVMAEVKKIQDNIVAPKNAPSAISEPQWAEPESSTDEIRR